VGGAVATEEIVPGYRFDLGGSAHILIRLTPIVEELGLERFGLEYLELDPSSSPPSRTAITSSSTATRSAPEELERSSRRRGRRTAASSTSGAPSRGW
jgi:phytoene dehydrogenase-like protein